MYITVATIEISQRDGKTLARGTSILPVSGERFSFVGQGVSQSGIYGVVGKLESGTYNGQAWKRVTGRAVPLALADAEQWLAKVAPKL